jgi:hypothetical protein
MKFAFENKLKTSIGSDMVRNRGSTPIIVFVGTVGAGKSTQIKVLTAKLDSLGFRVKRVALKNNHLVARLLSSLLSKLIKDCKKDAYSILTLTEDAPNIFRRMLSLWVILDLASITLRQFVDIVVPKKFGYIVIVEDYIPAFICDYFYFCHSLGLSDKVSPFVLKYLEYLFSISGPVNIAFLDAPEEILSARWKNRGTPDERTKYLLFQRSVLLPLSKNMANNFLFIDTSRIDVLDTHNLILNSLLSFLKVQKAIDI